MKAKVLLAFCERCPEPIKLHIDVYAPLRKKDEEAIVELFLEAHREKHEKPAAPATKKRAA